MLLTTLNRMLIAFALGAGLTALITEHWGWLLLGYILGLIVGTINWYLSAIAEKLYNK